MYIKPLTFVYIQPIHNNFAQLFVSKNEGDLHWTIWNLTPPKLGALTGLQLVTIWNLPGWLIWNSFSDSPRKLGPPHTVKYISEYKKYLTGHQASECIRYQGTKSSADTNYSSSIQKSRSGFFSHEKKKDQFQIAIMVFAWLVLFTDQNSSISRGGGETVAMHRNYN